MNDLHTSLNYAFGFAPVVVTDNTATSTSIIDMSGYHVAEFVIITGTLADVDAAFTVLVQHGDASNLSDATDVADADLVGTESDAGFTFAADNATRKIGYKGVKRYVRLTVTPANNTGNAPIACVVVRAPRHIS